MSAQHIPVLLNEVLEFINCKDGGIYVDATLGSAGHAAELLKRYPGIGMLIGIDCDQDAIGRAKKKLEPFSQKVQVLHGNFRNLKSILSRAGITGIDGILFDLGVSTPQLKDPSRGFSFSLDGSLDMRMDKTIPVKAQDLVAASSERELADILRTYGEERWAKRIAARIKQRAAQSPLETTTDLARIVLRAMPGRSYPEKIHPATRTFQALRIAVNDEMGALERGLEDAVDLLAPGGRLCVISFHSLEDSLVKHTFKGWEKGCRCPSTIPVCVCNEKQKIRIITRKPAAPSEQEVRENPSARSSRLRVAERI